MLPLCTNTSMWVQHVHVMHAYVFQGILPLALQSAGGYSCPVYQIVKTKLLVIESTATTGVTRAHCKDFVVKHHSGKSF